MCNYQLGVHFSYNHGLTPAYPTEVNDLFLYSRTGSNSSRKRRSSSNQYCDQISLQNHHSCPLNHTQMSYQRAVLIAVERCNRQIVTNRQDQSIIYTPLCTMNCILLVVKLFSHNHTPSDTDTDLHE